VVGLLGGILGVTSAMVWRGGRWRCSVATWGWHLLRPGAAPAVPAAGQRDLRLLGVAAGVAGAWLPAQEADGGTGPGPEGRRRGRAARRRGHPLVGLALLAVSLAACAIPPVDGLPLGGYLAVACVLAGAVLLLPSIAALLARLLPGGGLVPARSAVARLAAAPGHAVVAAAGVLTSVALAARWRSWWRPSGIRWTSG
jgi:putative ABC transport system permease protein